MVTNSVLPLSITPEYSLFYPAYNVSITICQCDKMVAEILKNGNFNHKKCSRDVKTIKNELLVEF